MSDIFHEVDEEVRREQLKKLWDRYGWLMIAACVVVVLAVGGWRGYEYWQAQLAAKAGGEFQAAMALANEGKHEEAEDAFAKLANDATPTYRTLAKFREAAEMAERDAKGAVGLYDQLAADGSIGQTFQDLAALRGAILLVDTAPYTDITKRLEPLTAADRTFRHTARATLALAAWRAKDLNAMRHWTDMVLADAETPAGTRGQVQMLLALTDADKKS